VSAFSEATRTAVATRAAHRCEYRHLPTRGQVATYPIDHVIPRSANGPSDPSNLALTCPHCNAHKWCEGEGIDPVTGRVARFFHPRRDEWAEHFEWSRFRPGELTGKTPSGRATIAGLRMNDDDMIELRQLLAELGLFPDARVSS
jgi:hypothetical protein